MAGPVGSFYAAKGSRIIVGAQILYKSDWDVDDHADKLDTTNFESGGFAQATTGIEECDWNGKGLWTSTSGNGQFSPDPPGLYPRDNLQSTSLLLNVAALVSWSFPVSIVVSAKNSASVRDLVKFEWSAFSNGTFTRPAG